MTEGENDYPSVTYGDSSPDKGSLLGAPQKRRNVYMKATGDVCDRRRWRMKGAKRSGRGRNLAMRTASNKFRAPQQGL